MEEDQDQGVDIIRDSAGAVVPKSGDLTRVRSLRFGLPGFTREVWTQAAELGWLGLRVDENAGGAGFGMRAFCALAEQLGRGLVPEPFVPCVAAARLLTGDALARHIAGELIILPAWPPQTLGKDQAAGNAIGNGKASGYWPFIPMAKGADAFLIATKDGAAIVKPDASGATLTTDQRQDGGHFGALTLADTPVEAIKCQPADALEEATLGNAAYLLGTMERAFEITLDYLRTRQQFGKLIGSFQSLQHRAADLKIQIALTRASVESAAALLDSGTSPQLRQAVVSQAKARAAEAGMLVTRQAIQLHGGIGYTDEHDISLFLRSAMVHANQYGSAAFHRKRYATQMPDTDEG